MAQGFERIVEIVLQSDKANPSEQALLVRMLVKAQGEKVEFLKQLAAKEAERIRQEMEFRQQLAAKEAELKLLNEQLLTDKDRKYERLLHSTFLRSLHSFALIHDSRRPARHIILSQYVGSFLHKACVSQSLPCFRVSNSFTACPGYGKHTGPYQLGNAPASPFGGFPGAYSSCPYSTYRYYAKNQEPQKPCSCCSHPVEASAAQFCEGAHARSICQQWHHDDCRQEGRR